jgi:hypothetical protein
MNAQATQSCLATQADQMSDAGRPEKGVWISQFKSPDTISGPGRAVGRRLGSVLLAFSFCVLTALPAAAAESVPGRARPPDTSGPRHNAPAAIVAVMPLSTGICGSVFSPLQSALGNRRRMLQFGVIGMCIALYIIMWRR